MKGEGGKRGSWFWALCQVCARTGWSTVVSTTRYLALPRNLQMAIIQGTMLYAAELTGKRQRGIEGEHQAAINLMGEQPLGPSEWA